MTHAEAIRALAGALLLGLSGDLLLRSIPWGLNLPLWVAAVAGACVWMEHGASRRTGHRWIPLALAAAALAAWRDSPTLKALDLGALGLVLALAAWSARGGAVRRSGIAEQVRALGSGAFAAMAGAAPFASLDLRWREVPHGPFAGRAGAVLRGLALAIPVVAVFGTLLAAADAEFERLLRALGSWDADVAMSHVVLTGALAWVAAGLLHAVPLRGGGVPARAPALPAPALGIVEVAIVLGLLNALFLAFVLVQVPYLFGGAAFVEGEGALSYAEYARRGFFELVGVAGLVLPLLLALHWFLRAERPLHTLVFRGFAWTQVALVGVIVASALHRMRLYQAAYGLTELRLYTTAFMLWLLLVLGWFCATVLRGARDRFAFGALVAAGGVLVLLHAANPDGWIVRTNLARATAARPFDAGYALSLSADAAPVLVRGLPRLPLAERCRAARALEARWSPAGDWRAWSWSRHRARAAVAGDLAAGCPAGAGTGRAAP